MIHLKRTTADDHDFRDLVKQLDGDLAIINGTDHKFYSRHNTLDKIKHVVVAYLDGEPVGCGAMKEYDAETMEIKRMYVNREKRNKGIATKVLAELELWAGELSYTKCILETSKRQPDAIALYTKSGYKTIPNFGQYIGFEISVCFVKELS